MHTYYVQYVVRKIKPKFLDSYFSILEKDLRQLSTIDFKHSFITDGKIYINIYVKEKEPNRAGKIHLDKIQGVVFNALNYEDEDNEIKIDITKVELVD